MINCTHHQSASARPDVRQVEVFYDGDCPLCHREIELLRKLDRRERIQFTDIAAAAFRTDGLGVSHDQLMGEIHARLPDGSLIKGVEVFRRLYAAVGFGPLVSLTRLPGVSHALDAAYSVFARNRLRWTNRCDAGCRVESAR